MQLRENIANEADQEAHADAHTRKPVRQTFIGISNGSTRGCTPCHKDWTEPCPLGWIESSDGACSAPLNYEGICSTTQRFQLMGVVDKSEAERTCGFCWPCKNSREAGVAASCDRAYWLPCPYGYNAAEIPYNQWRHVSPRCQVGLEYRGHCAPQVSFGSAIEKQRFAEQCDTDWPCVMKCDVLGHPCPEGWAHLEHGLCAAPSWYKAEGNSCLLLRSFKHFSTAMKEGYAKECGVPWTCSGKAPKDECEPDTSKCPKGWTMFGNTCKTKRSSYGLCNQPVRFDVLTFVQKIRWASDCFEEWPCAGVASERLYEHAQALIENISGPVGADGVILFAGP